MTQNRAIMDLASRYRETWLFNIWRMGTNSIQNGSTDHWTVTPKRIAALEAAAASLRLRCRRGRWTRRPWWTRRRRGGGAGGGRRCAGGGGTFGGTARAIPAELYNTILHDPKLRDPRGYIIPSDQADFATATEFVNALLKNGITVSTRDRRVPGGRQELSGGFVRGEGRAGVPPARDGHVRAAGPSQRFRLSRRSAEASLRHHRLDARHADGRAVRPRDGRLRRAVHKNHRAAAAARRCRSSGRPILPAI